ncbi:MAG: hypothetical protein NVV82_00365 [Sporocytophaga sp.]|nr:hypothetical protein [Sporocytophaga sp.]
MINNLEHSTAVYYSVSKKKLTEIFSWQYADWLESVLVIVVIDLSVIAWIKMNRYWEAGVFAFLIVLINLLYYQWPGVFSLETNKRIAEFLFSAMFGFGLISFSYLSAKLNELALANEELPDQHLLKISELESGIKILE